MRGFSALKFCFKTTTVGLRRILSVEERMHKLRFKTTTVGLRPDTAKDHSVGVGMFQNHYGWIETGVEFSYLGCGE